MLFVNYRLLMMIGVAALLVFLGTLLYKILRPVRHPFVRQAFRFVAVGIGSLSIFPLFLAGCGLAMATNSWLVYSPDRRYAVRVTDLDGGAIGGNTAVIVYGSHGFRNDTVLYGPWKIVEPKDISWESNSEVLIQFPTSTGYDPPTCKNFGKVKVTCVPKPH